MDVKEAVSVAKNYAFQLFEDERPQNIGLEEVEFASDEGIWYVTIGLSRPWDREETPSLSSIAEIMGSARKSRRDMKVLAIDNETSTVISVKNRE